MLPMKLDLTEELAATLRQLRLNHPVNGEVLTAENLSKAIGNNRAWMSQIESRRLKKIRREDIIAIYKVLYGEENDYNAEYRAEVDLMKFIFDGKDDNSEFISGGSIDSIYSDDAYNEYRNKHEGTNYTDKDLLYEKQRLMEISNNLVNHFMTHLKDIPTTLEHSNLINQFAEFEDKLNHCLKDTLYVTTELPLYALQYATEEERNAFISAIDNAANILYKVSAKHDLEVFIANLDAAKKILTDYPKYKEDIPVDELLKSVTTMLVQLCQHVTSEGYLSMEKKVNYTNDMIFIIYYCGIIAKTRQSLTIKELPENATVSDIYSKINELQIFLSNIESNPMVIMGQISKYFST